MANYNIVIGSGFKPFSYQEMLAPVLMAQQLHQAIEDAYGELETKASAWDLMASELNDPIAHNRFQQYANALRAEAESLSANGLTPSSRKRMLGLKSRYASDIAPIELAYQRRKELQDEQRKALLSNPTLMFQRNLNNIGYESSLDRFIENQNYDYGESYSGALLTQQVASQAIALSKELRDLYEKGDHGAVRKKLESIGIPYQYRLLEAHGFSSDAVLKAIANDSNANYILTSIVDKTLQSSGMADWADLATMKRARDYAAQGLWNAVGQSEYKYITDQAGLTRLQYDLQDRNNQRAEARDAARRKEAMAEAAKAEQLRMYRNNSTPLYSKDEIIRYNNKYMKDYNKWHDKHYITWDGKLTNRGNKDAQLYAEYLYRTSKGEKITGATAGRMQRGRDFYNWAVKQGLRVTVTPTTNLNRYGNSYITYPVTTNFTSFNRNVSGMFNMAKTNNMASGVANIEVNRVRVGEGEVLRNLINLITSTNSNIYAVGYLGSDGKLAKGKAMTATQFGNMMRAANAPAIVHLVNNPVGNLQFIELANGEKYFIPTSVWGKSIVDPMTGRGDMDKMNDILRKEAGSHIPHIPSDRALGAFSNTTAYLSSLLDYSSGQNIDYHGSITTETLGVGNQNKNNLIFIPWKPIR